MLQMTEYFLLFLAQLILKRFCEIKEYSSVVECLRGKFQPTIFIMENQGQVRRRGNYWKELDLNLRP